MTELTGCAAAVQRRQKDVVREIDMQRFVVFAVASSALLGFLTQGTSAQSGDAGSLVERGRAHEAVGDSARERAVALNSLGQSPDEAVQAEMEAYELAIEAYSAAIEIDPQSSEAYARRGLVRAKRDRDGNREIIAGSAGVLGMVAKYGPESLIDADRAIELAPDDPLVHFVRGEILTMQFRNTWEIYTGMSEGEFGRSMVKPDANHANGAIMSYSRAVELDPTLCEALESIGTIYFLGFKFDGAFDYLSRANDCGIPQDVAFLDRLREISENPAEFLPASTLNDFEIPYPPGG